jgi:hypothetical protein
MLSEEMFAKQSEKRCIMKDSESSRSGLLFRRINSVQTNSFETCMRLYMVIQKEDFCWVVVILISF